MVFGFGNVCLKNKGMLYTEASWFHPPPPANTCTQHTGMLGMKDEGPDHQCARELDKKGLC